MDHGDHHEGHGTTTQSHGGHDGHDMGGGHDMSMSHMMMIMHDGFKETVVFPKWVTTNEGEFAGTFIALTFIGILYEAVKFLRDTLIEKRILENKVALNDYELSNGKMKEVKKPVKEPSYLSRVFSLENAVQTLLYVTQFTISYFLMLAFMIANYWLCLAILIGVGIGYFFFGIRRVKSSSLTTHVDDGCCE